MAFFAELNIQNQVLRVMIVGDENVAFPKDPAAEQFCKDHFQNDPNIVLVNGEYPGVSWKQTFKDSTRGQYASPGWEYDPIQDIFIQPKPFASFVSDSKGGWQAPVAFPTIDDLGNFLPRDGIHSDNLFIGWDEPSISWVGSRNKDGFVIDKRWNPLNKTWTTINMVEIKTI